MAYARVVKQASYAGGFLLFLAIITGGFIVIATSPTLRGPQLAPTPSALFQPIAVEQVDVVAHDGNADFIARLRNPNTRAGVVMYPVTFVVVNERGEEIRRHVETTYLLPGSLQYAVALAVPVAPRQFSVRVEVPPEPSFTELPETLELPVFGAFLRERGTRQVGNRAIEEQKGIVRNNGTFDFQRVQLTALASDAQGRVVGVGKTFLGELKVGEQREFTVQWPAPIQPTTKVVTLLSTNVFLEETIIRVIGDPSSLR
ncbi:MAG: hypothetical protein WEA04_02335 [Candidatus Andersenbacteria bacterium]